MYDCRQFFINGEWLAPGGREQSLVINPATEEPVGRREGFKEFLEIKAIMGYA